MAKNARDKDNYKQSQSLAEYFLLLGVFAVLIVVASSNSGFNRGITQKMIEYRDSKAGVMGISTAKPPNPVPADRDRIVCYDQNHPGDGTCGGRSAVSCCDFSEDVDECEINGVKEERFEVCRSFCVSGLPDCMKDGQPNPDVYAGALPEPAPYGKGKLGEQGKGAAAGVSYTSPKPRTSCAHVTCKHNTCGGGQDNDETVDCCRAHDVDWCIVTSILIDPATGDYLKDFGTNHAIKFENKKQNFKETECLLQCVSPENRPFQLFDPDTWH